MQVLPETKTSGVTGMKMLLWCGILSSLWYLVINIYVPMQYENYSVITYTVSELSAIGAPTRSLWVSLVILYPILFGAFGWGILRAEAHNKKLRTIGGLIIFYSVFNIYWPPMHMRGSETSLTDTLHIAWAGVTLLLMLSMMVIGATTFGKGFKIFTMIAILLHFFFGILTSIEAPNIPTNGPTPTIGLWERINIGIFMLWVVVLAAMILSSNRLSENQNKKFIRKFL